MKTFPLLILLAFIGGGIVLAAEPARERIVCLGGCVTETVFFLGAGDLVVARDASSLVPAAVQRLPDVGYFRTIGAEGVLAQQPTLILAAQGTGPENQVAILRSSGIRFVHVDAKPSAASTLAMISQVGAAVGRTKEAEALAATLRAQFATAEALGRKSPRPPKIAVLMGAGTGIYQAAFDDTAGSALVALAGGRNPFHGVPGYKPTSAEELIAADPDFILVGTRSGPIFGAELGRLPAVPDALRGTRAAQTGRLYHFDMGYYLMFGPRTGEAVLALTRTIHGAEP